VQLLMGFAETKPTQTVEPTEPVWLALDPTNRSEIVATLARLIAKAATPGEHVVELEVRDE
jgi:hypothetical protein